MIDYEKTTPWRVRGQGQPRKLYVVENAKGETVAQFNRREDAERACLLMAAAEVQERRGWHADKHYDKWAVFAWGTDKWVVPWDESGSLWPDPAEAIVEADLWTRQQEKGAGLPPPER